MYKKAKKQLYNLYSCHKFFHFPSVFTFVKFYTIATFDAHFLNPVAPVVPFHFTFGADFLNLVAPVVPFHFTFGADFNRTASGPIKVAVLRRL